MDRLYVGVNAGIGFGRARPDIALAGGLVDPRSRVGGLGGLGGAQIGYNCRLGNMFGLGNIVFGVEADIQGAGLEDNRTSVASGLGSNVGINVQSSTSDRHRA